MTNKSGRHLVNLFFRILVHCLAHKIQVFKLRCLKDEKNKALCGWFFPKDENNKTDTVFLGIEHDEHAGPDGLPKTLIHEVAHYALPKVAHRYIYEFENRLWECLTPEQKKVFRSFVPKHTVKRGPKQRGMM